MVDVVNVRHLASQLVRHLAQLVTRAVRIRITSILVRECRTILHSLIFRKCIENIYGLEAIFNDTSV